MLEASLRVQGCLLLQQQQQPALQGQAIVSLVCLAKLLPLMARQQQPSPMLLSLLLSLCKLARVYAPGVPGVTLVLSCSVLELCGKTFLATSDSDGSSSGSSSSSSGSSGSDSSSSSSGGSDSSSQVLPVCAVLARGLHCHADALQQSACEANRARKAAMLQDKLSGPQVLKLEELVGTAVAALTGNLCRSAAAGLGAAAQEQLKQQGEVVLAGMEAALQSDRSGSEQLRDWAQQLQQFAAAAAAAVPLASACNNPCCVGLERLAEGQLVGGRRCSRCKAGYCSDACQTAHWKGHRKACKLLAATGARAWA
jgi:hypothetical protein